MGSVFETDFFYSDFFYIYKYTICIRDVLRNHEYDKRLDYDENCTKFKTVLSTNLFVRERRKRLREFS